jgi:hypothetical protein
MTPTCTERARSLRSARRAGATQSPSPTARRSRPRALLAPAPENQSAVQRDGADAPATATPAVRRRFSIGMTFDRHHLILAENGGGAAA